MVEPTRSIDRSLRILLVDGDPNFLKAAKQCLNTYDELEVDIASSVNEAFERLKNMNYDAVVSDYQMPDGDRLGFLKELREKGNTLPFIVFTGKGREEIAIEALNLGADHYVDKHGDPETVYCQLACGIREAVTRKKEYLEVMQEQERLRATFASSPDAMIFCDLQGNVIDCNHAMLELTGYQSEKEIVGRSAHATLVAEKDRERALKNMKKTLEHGMMKMEHTLLKKSGEEYSAEISANVIRGASGKTLGIAAILRDITERKKTMEGIKAMNERLNILFEFAPDAYYLNDLKGNLIDGNRAAEQLIGYSRSELLGKNLLKVKLLSRNQILKAAKLLTMNALGKSTGPDEFVLNRKDGTQVPVEITTHPVRIRDRAMVLAIARDITIRKKQEQTIVENQQKFEALFKNNPEPTVFLSQDFRILDVNSRFCQLFGYSAEEVKDTYINELVVPEAMREEADRLDKNAKEGYASSVTVRKRKDGTLVFVSISVTPITILGKLSGYVGVYKDITDQKNIEACLKETSRKFEVMNEKLHVVGELTRHDVRNKLSVVSGNVYLLKKKLTKDPESLEQLTNIEVAVHFVEKIFEFARTYERLGVEQLTFVDVGKTIDKATSLFPNQKVKIANECRGLAVLADSLLQQLFYNLIDNSVKYGGEIRQIRVYYKTPSTDQLELIYEDDGVGIPDNLRSSLFKEGCTSGKGTGYGLFMTRRICEMYGWTIRETGKQGKGVQFTMSIRRNGMTGKTHCQFDR